MYPFQKLTIPELVTRSPVMTRNPNRPVAATAPPVADAEQILRDQYFAELVERCRASFVSDATIENLLVETGRSRAELDAALDREEINEGVSATSPARQPDRVFEKETKMSDQEKRQTKKEWDAAVQAQHAAHPEWTKAKCISAVTVENPTLHARFVDSANS